jgi:hypothetical protein
MTIQKNTIMTIQEIVSSQMSAEVILHAGNARACIFGKVTDYGDGCKFIIVPQPDSPNSIIFTIENIKKITANQHHAVIYIN